MEKFEIVVKTSFGFEEILAEELRGIGAKNPIKLKRAVSFWGDTKMLYKCNYLLRTAIKVLKPIATFTAQNEHELYNNIRQIPWDEILRLNQTLAVDGVTNGKIFTHSKFVALKTKDAIVDQFRDNYGERPSIDTRYPDLRINVRINHTGCTVSLDSSGQSLFKRGYKQLQTPAPLNEVMASGIILLSNWDKKRPFIDPMCGSGTLAIEAALMAKNIPAGSFREFGFMYWNDFDKKLWQEVKDEAKSQILDTCPPIFASDLNNRALRIADTNAELAGVDEHIVFKNEDFLNSKAPIDNAVLIMNPPYGERLEEKDEMIDFYKEIGHCFKQKYSGCDAWIFSGNIQAMKAVGLRPSKKIQLFNGPIECKLHHYELFKGSKFS